MNQFAFLIYERWRSTRTLFFIAFAVSITPSLLAYDPISSYTIAELDTLRIYALGGVHIAQITWIAYLLIASGDNEDLKFTMPGYLLRLPVKSWKLAAARMMFGAASIAFLALAGRFVSDALLDPMVDLGLFSRYMAVIYPIIYVALQAIAWWIGPAGIMSTVAAIAFAIIAIFRILNVYVDMYRPPVLDPALGTAETAAGIAIAVLFFFSVGTAAIAQHRRGRFSGLGLPLLFDKKRGAVITLGANPFASKAEALRWYEYRRQWSLFPRVLLGVFVALFVILGFAFVRAAIQSRAFYGGDVKANLAGILRYESVTTLTLGLPLSALVFLFRGWRPVFKKDGAFLFNRPTSTLELAAARWNACIRAIAVGVLPLMAIYVVTSLLNIHMPSGESNPQQLSTFDYLLHRYPAHVFLPLCVALSISFLVVVWVACGSRILLQRLPWVGSLRSPSGSFHEDK